MLEERRLERELAKVQRLYNRRYKQAKDQRKSHYDLEVLEQRQTMKSEWPWIAFIWRRADYY